MNITFRKPTANNVEEIYTLYHKTWLATYPNEALGITHEDICAYIPERISTDDKKRLEGRYNNISDNIFILVAIVNEKIVGVCSGEKNDEKTHLRSLYILPEFQGKGIGFALWEQFKAWAGTEKLITVHVATYNTNAINFYASVGFVDTGKRFVEERFIFKSGAQMPEMEMVLEK
jgi:ribosomal protein S18 acetylase RimI-like enzyme